MPGQPRMLATGPAVAGVAVVALVGPTLLVQDTTAPRWEHDVVDAATGLPGVIGGPLVLVMQMGRRALVPLVAVAVFVATRKARATLGVVVAGLATGYGVDAWKELASRPRPTGVPTREDADGFGFPSGHTAIAFALATVIAAYVPERWRPAPFVVAVLVGVGRVYAGVHHPLDLVGGALWGVAVGALMLTALPPGLAGASRSARRRASRGPAGGGR